MKQHILSLVSLHVSVMVGLTASAEDVRLTLERPIEFESLRDCQDAAEVLELMYRRYHIEPLAICETNGSPTESATPHTDSEPVPEGGETERPLGPPPSPPLDWEREA